MTVRTEASDYRIHAHGPFLLDDCELVEDVHQSSVVVFHSYRLGDVKWQLSQIPNVEKLHDEVQGVSDLRLEALCHQMMTDFQHLPELPTTPKPTTFFNNQVFDMICYYC